MKQPDARRASQSPDVLESKDTPDQVAPILHVRPTGVRWPVSALKLVSDFPDGEDVPGLGGIRLELPAELCNVSVHGPAHDGSTVSPDRAQQFVPAGDPALPLQQCNEEIELLRRKLDALLPTAYGACSDIDLDVAEALDRRRRHRAHRATPVSRTTNQRLDPSKQLQHAERLRDIVVGAHAEPEDLVGFLATRREDEHRHRASLVA